MNAIGILKFNIHLAPIAYLAIITSAVPRPHNRNMLDHNGLTHYKQKCQSISINWHIQ